MNRTRRVSRRGTTRRYRPRLEGLEVREVLSVLPGMDASAAVIPDPSIAVSVVQVDPAPGSVLTQSPTTITVTFNDPIDPFSLLGADFGLETLDANGNPTGPADPTVLAEPDDIFSSDPSNVLRLTVTQPLTPGQTYQVVLFGVSSIAGFDPNGDIPWNDTAGAGNDQPLTSFTIAQPGVTLSDATPLGPVMATPSVAASGNLDLANNPSAVDLYQFTLPAGHFWRLGAAIDATRMGSGLNSSLALFDSQGNLITSATIGRPDFPSDPYLFAGLQPGTYYIGVSGYGNVADQPGGYDPASGTSGISLNQTGGAYQLELVADAEDTPTALQGFALNWADPLDTTPTGFTLAFAGAMNIASFEPPSGQAFTALQVVDQNGQSWPITPVGYQESTSQFKFLFNEALPAGHYTLRLPSQGPITDLAGRTPVAPGQPAGVLASWTVQRQVNFGGPNNVGPLFPAHLVQGFNFSENLAPGSAMTYRMVSLIQTTCQLETDYSGGSYSIQLVGPDGVRTFDPGAPGTLTSNLIILNPGVYYLSFIATSDQPVHIHGTYIGPPIDSDSLIASGVGQGPALNLSFLTPSASNLNSTQPNPSAVVGPTVPAPSVPVPASTVSSTGTAPSAEIQATAIAVSGPASPGGLVVTLGGSLAGAPAASTSVATTVTSDSTTLASIAVSPNQGFGPTSSISGWLGSDSTVIATTDPGVTPPSPPVPTEVEVAANPPLEADAKVLADTAWIGQIGERLTHMFALAPESAPEPFGPVDSSQAPPERVALRRDDRRQPETERVEEADLGMPLGMVVAAVVASRLRHPVQRWWRRHGKHGPQLLTHAHQGPHRRF